MKVLKQNVGIDISKDTFSASLVILTNELKTKRLCYKEFKNDKKGIVTFFSWSNKHKIKDLELHYTMEATGVYYEELAYFLHSNDQEVHILLPNRAKKFIDSLSYKSKTDKIDSELIGHMGLERELPSFELGSKNIRMMRKLTRERSRLVEQKTMIKNQLHAEQHSVDSMETIMDRMQEMITYIETQIKDIEREIDKIIQEDINLSNKMELLTSIPGISFITATTIIAETQGFSNFKNIKQLSSYAGYDVKLKESGKYKGKSRISKQGNSYIRACLYMPSIASISHSQSIKKFYNRVNENKASKLIGLTAVQRKLLALMYTLWKKNEKYDENKMLKAA